MKLIIWGAFVAALLGLALFMLNPLNRLVLTSRTGQTPQASFPIDVVGQDFQSARDALEGAGIRYSREVTSGRCANVEIGENYRAFMFRDTSWRRGVVCLLEQDGVVESVAWWFSPGAP